MLFLSLILIQSSYIIASPVPLKEQFNVHKVSSSCLESEAKVECAVDDNVVGYVHCTKIPFAVYALHTLFVCPEFRGKGYAKKLLTFATEKLKKAGARRIFIQPGPFEMKDGELQNLPKGVERTDKIRKLIALYKSVGFKRVSKTISNASKLIYYFAGIEENPDHLMAM